MARKHGIGSAVKAFSMSDTVKVCQDLSRRRQLHDADMMDGDWLTQQLAYDLLSAPYSRRLFGHPMEDAPFTDRVVDFLSMEWPGEPSWLDVVVPAEVRRDVKSWIDRHMRKGGNEGERASSEETMEDLSRMWFEVWSKSSLRGAVPLTVLTHPEIARKYQMEATRLGVVSMIEAWKAGVPAADVVA